MIYEGAYISNVEEDLRNLPKEEVEKILDKFESILSSPNTKTERVMNKSLNLRKLRKGDYRLFILVDEGLSVVYALSCVHRKSAYNIKTLKEIEKLAKNILSSDNNKKY